MWKILLKKIEKRKIRPYMKRQFAMRLLLAFHWGLIWMGNTSILALMLNPEEDVWDWEGDRQADRMFVFGVDHGNRIFIYSVFKLFYFPMHSLSFLWCSYSLSFSSLSETYAKSNVISLNVSAESTCTGWIHPPSHSHFRQMDAKAEGNVPTINAPHLRLLRTAN